MVILQVKWLRQLLRSRHLPAKRAKWWNRLSIDLAEPANLDKPHEAWCACQQALGDPWLVERCVPEYATLRRRFIRLSQKLKRQPVVRRSNRDVVLKVPMSRKPGIETIHGKVSQCTLFSFSESTTTLHLVRCSTTVLQYDSTTVQYY